MRDHARGRIYRLVVADALPGAKAVAQGGAPADLVAGLAGPTQVGRLQAQRLLVEGKVKAAVPALLQLVTQQPDSLGAIHALWALQGLGALDEVTHQKALLSLSAPLRRNAVRAPVPTPRRSGFSSVPAPSRIRIRRPGWRPW